VGGLGLLLFPTDWAPIDLDFAGLTKEKKKERFLKRLGSTNYEIWLHDFLSNGIFSIFF
jgi:hypothetical protein